MGGVGRWYGRVRCRNFLARDPCIMVAAMAGTARRQGQISSGEINSAHGAGVGGPHVKESFTRLLPQALNRQAGCDAPRRYGPGGCDRPGGRGHARHRVGRETNKGSATPEASRWWRARRICRASTRSTHKRLLRNGGGSTGVLGSWPGCWGLVRLPPITIAGRAPECLRVSRRSKTMGGGSG